jgi:hypothetical protein
METKKMSLGDLKGKLTRAEMKQILAGNNVNNIDDENPCLKDCTNDSTRCGGDCPNCKSSGGLGYKYCLT